MNKVTENKISLSTNKRGLYIHVPFCSSLCSYCDFAKMHHISSFIYPYLDSLKKEMESYNINDIKTIYIGGGTPSSLNMDELQYLLDIVKPYYDNNNIQEYTFECNIENVDENKLSLLKKYNVNRLSFGVQSSNEHLLKLMNRHHNFSDVKKVISLAKNIGFDNISVDLILGFKERTLSDLENEINDILSLDVQHISTYCLTLHKNTKLFIDKYISKDDDEMYEEMVLVNNLLKKANYINYEVSNFSLNDEYSSKHNMIYWMDEQYYGIGLSSSSYIDGYRYTNTRNIHSYIQKEYKREIEKVENEDEFLYYIMLFLRLKDGISLSDFENKFGFSFLCLNNTINKWERSSHLIKDSDTIKLSFEGRLILHTIVLDFLKEYEDGLRTKKK